ncbi:MAG: polysaccharide pyruvyl transferase family protein [Victivallaceae bacterium]|nr:polysaccharide pyruvyl transferase family protein [Victivallaceae bacterium]
MKSFAREAKKGLIRLLCCLIPYRPWRRAVRAELIEDTPRKQYLRSGVSWRTEQQEVLSILEQLRGRTGAEEACGTHTELKEVLCSLGRFVFLPNFGNMGDAVIARAEYEFFRKNHLEYDLFDGTKRYDEPFSLVYGGGGIWAAEWDYQNLFGLLQNPMLQKVVILPSSFSRCDDLGPILDERFTVFCREERSFQYLTELAPKTRVLRAGDMALTLNRESVFDLNGCTEAELERAKTLLCGGCQYRRIAASVYNCSYTVFQKVREAARAIPVSREGAKTAHFLRTDKESKNKLAKEVGDNFDLSTLLDETSLDPGRVQFLARIFFSVIDRFDTVVTDRLHVGIAAYILGKKVFWFDNSFGKVRGVYDFSLQGAKNIIFKEDNAIPDSIPDAGDGNASDEQWDRTNRITFPEYLVACVLTNLRTGVMR